MTPKTILRRVETLIVEADPDGLIKLGAPDDEYHYEAVEVYSHLRDCEDMQSFLVEVVSTFNASFNPPSVYSSQDLRALCERIWALKSHL